jgi:hypothetical protein
VAASERVAAREAHRTSSTLAARGMEQAQQLPLTMKAARSSTALSSLRMVSGMMTSVSLCTSTCLRMSCSSALLARMPSTFRFCASSSSWYRDSSFCVLHSGVLVRGARAVQPPMCWREGKQRTWGRPQKRAGPRSQL